MRCTHIQTHAIPNDKHPRLLFGSDEYRTWLSAMRDTNTGYYRASETYYVIHRSLTDAPDLCVKSQVDEFARIPRIIKEFYLPARHT